MLVLKTQEGGSYEVRGFLADMTECMRAIAWGDLEEAIELAMVEWCEDQRSATVYDAESGEGYVEIEADGRIRLLGGRFAWEIETA